MNPLQARVRSFLDEHGHSCAPGARLLDVASEAGELSKEYLVSTSYGAGPFEAGAAWRDELGDLLFSVLALACETETDAEEVLGAALAKYRDRIRRTGGPGAAGALDPEG